MNLVMILLNHWELIPWTKIHLCDGMHLSYIFPRMLNYFDKSFIALTCHIDTIRNDVVCEGWFLSNRITDDHLRLINWPLIPHAWLRLFTLAISELLGLNHHQGLVAFDSKEYLLRYDRIEESDLWVSGPEYGEDWVTNNSPENFITELKLAVALD